MIVKLRLGKDTICAIYLEGRSIHQWRTLWSYLICNWSKSTEGFPVQAVKSWRKAEAPVWSSLLSHVIAIGSTYPVIWDFALYPRILSDQISLFYWSHFQMSLVIDPRVCFYRSRFEHELRNGSRDPPPPLNDNYHRPALITLLNIAHWSVYIWLICQKM